MPAPINSSSSYPMNQVSECDPSLASCEAAPPAPSPIELLPVTIDGDAGARALIEGYDRNRTPDCSAERNSAILSCFTAGASAVAAVASSATLVGAVGGFLTTLGTSALCGKDLRAYSDCKDQ
jgi:hypothetical protein